MAPHIGANRWEWAPLSLTNTVLWPVVKELKWWKIQLIFLSHSSISSFFSMPLKCSLFLPFNLCLSLSCTHTHIHTQTKKLTCPWKRDKYRSISIIQAQVYFLELTWFQLGSCFHSFPLNLNLKVQGRTSLGHFYVDFSYPVPGNEMLTAVCSYGPPLQQHKLSYKIIDWFRCFMPHLEWTSPSMTLFQLSAVFLSLVAQW